MCAATLRRMWFGRILWLESVPDVSTLRTEGTVGLDTLVGNESGGRVTPWTLNVGSRRRKGSPRHGASLPDLRRRSLFKSEQATRLCCCAQISVARGVMVSEWTVVAVCRNEGKGNETEGNKDEGRRIQRPGVSRFGPSLQRRLRLTGDQASPSTCARR